MVRLLSRSDMVSILSMQDVIHVVEEGFRTVNLREDHIPVRLPLNLSDKAAVALFMPAYLSASQTLGAKTVTVFPDNPAHGVPVIMGYYTLCDAVTGKLIALMDATYLTGIRTAAASAVATKYLARKEARRLGIIGAGVQAHFHAKAMMAVRSVDEIMVYNRSVEQGEKLVQELTSRYAIPTHFMDTPDSCAAEADILVTCTATKEPLFNGKVLNAGTHINAIGAYTPDMRELDSHTIREALVFVDTYEGAFEEAGDILIPLSEGVITSEHIRAELTELVRGLKSGRTNERDITVFKSVGYAMEDAVTARLAYEKAVERDIGMTFDLDA
jgi:ornithine cyclodeaminase/alanine dehydrogenase